MARERRPAASASRSASRRGRARSRGAGRAHPPLDPRRPQFPDAASARDRALAEQPPAGADDRRAARQHPRRSSRQVRALRRPPAVSRRRGASDHRSIIASASTATARSRPRRRSSGVRNADAEHRRYAQRDRAISRSTRSSPARRSAACRTNFTTCRAAGGNFTYQFRSRDDGSDEVRFRSCPRRSPCCAFAAPLRAQDAPTGRRRRPSDDEPVAASASGVTRAHADRGARHADAAARPTRRPAIPRRSAARSPRSSPPTCAIRACSRRSGPAGCAPSPSRR